jgi:uncharacterized protein
MKVRLRFYEELNFFLREEQRKRIIDVEAAEGQTVKDLGESFGVPHVEIDLILVDGESVDFSYQVRPGDFISFYPVFERLDIAGLSGLRPEPLRVPRFIADVHLGTLARRLRFLGFSTEYGRRTGDEELARRCAEEDLILLTRDRQLLMRRIVSRGLYVRSTDPFEQVREVVRRLDLFRLISPFSRCVGCNGELRPLPTEGGEWERHKGEIPPGVRRWCRAYKICRCCGKIYWKGSHFEKLEALLQVLEEEGKGGEEG